MGFKSREGFSEYQCYTSFVQACIQVCCSQEEELRSLQDAHVKKMTRLNYELEQVRTEGEWPTH